MSIATGGKTPTSITIDVPGDHILALIHEALAAKGLALRLDRVDATSVTFGVQADEATLAESRARTAAAGND